MWAGVETQFYTNIYFDFLGILKFTFFLTNYEKEDGSIKFLTKGDNNSVDDRGLYAPGQLWLDREDVVGRARGFLPYVGIVTIIMNDYPKFKYAVLACLGFYVLIHRE